MHGLFQCSFCSWCGGLRRASLPPGSESRTDALRTHERPGLNRRRRRRYQIPLHTPELNDTQRIRPDGTIDLQIIGKVKAEGKSIAALQEELNRRYASELKRPSVTVTAKDLRNNKVYVGGEVNKPGQVEVPGRLTVLEAIGQAGGFSTTSANVSQVVIIRNRNGKQNGTVVDLKQTLSGEETQPFYLQPGDTVYVPQTNIAALNQWVDQHINKMLPRIPLGLGLTP
jgi:protein involved in polysaccharide export with SLBB domain